MDGTERRGNQVNNRIKTPVSSILDDTMEENGVGPASDDYQVKNVEIVLQLPSHPALLTMVSEFLQELGETTTRLAMVDCQISLDDGDSRELMQLAAEGYEGKFITAMEWFNALMCIAKTSQAIDELGTDEWTFFLGDNHPLSNLAKLVAKSRDLEGHDMTKDEFLIEVKTAALEINAKHYDCDPRVVASIINCDTPEDVIMTLTKKVEDR